jgi:putative ABC transport system permease protein
VWNIESARPEERWQIRDGYYCYMRTIGKELRYGLRGLRRSPLFSTFAILSLTLGIAANLAIFSIVNGVLLKPLPFYEPDRLFGIVEIIPKLAHLYPLLPVNPRHTEEWNKTVPGIERFGMAQSRHVVLGGFEHPLRVPAEAVTPGLLTTLAVQPLMGRLIQASDAREGHDHVALLAYSLWRGQFAGDPAIVGRDVRINGSPHQVIGVLPPSFRYPLTGWHFDIESEPELFTPLWSRLSDHSLEGDYNYSAIARLRPGVRRETALAALNTAQAALAKTFPDKMEIRADLIPLSDLAVQNSRASLLVVLGAVTAVLLIVCLNLATLLLARGTRKNREIALRTALGASHWRLIREALMESLLLSAIGGALGISLAKVGFQAILAAAPATLPRRDAVSIDWNVVLFALGLTLVTTLLFGLYPAWRQSRRDPREALAASGRSNTGSKAGTRGRSILVGVEVGLSTVLLVIGGLLLTSFVRLMNTNPGFEIANHVSAQLNLPGANYSEPENVTQFYDQLIERLSTEPGIRQAAVISQLPLNGETWVDAMSRLGDMRPMFQKPTTNVRFISGSYFDAMGIRLASGRTFLLSDKSNAVVVVSAAVARVLWPSEEAVGQTLVLEDELFRVIGVAGETRADLAKSAPSVVYIPYWDHSKGMQADLNVVLHTSVPVRDAATVLRGAVAKLDSGVPISHFETFGEALSDTARQRRFQMLLVGGFALSALLVAALGIFGVIASVVSARRNEIGIRIALGASRVGVVGLVIRQGMLPVLAGLLAGIAVTLGSSSAIDNLLYQAGSADPLTLVGVTLLLGGVAVLACWIPARRAARIDPTEALRYE